MFYPFFSHGGNSDEWFVGRIFAFETYFGVWIAD